jgi:hypothetical protein
MDRGWGWNHRAIVGDWLRLAAVPLPKQRVLRYHSIQCQKETDESKEYGGKY